MDQLYHPLNMMHLNYVSASAPPGLHSYEFRLFITVRFKELVKITDEIIHFGIILQVYFLVNLINSTW